jgi:hypothetical protein
LRSVFLLATCDLLIGAKRLAAQAFTSDPIALVAVERAGGSISFSLHLVITVVADELENSGVNRSGMGFDGILINANFFVRHLVVIG